MKIRYGNSNLVQGAALALLIVLVICGIPARTHALGESTYSADTDILVNGILLRIVAGSTAASVSYGATDMTVVLGTGNSFTIQANDAHTELTNNRGLSVCGNPLAAFTVTTGTIVITPLATGCPLSVPTASAGGGVVLIKSNGAPQVPAGQIPGCTGAALYSPVTGQKCPIQGVMQLSADSFSFTKNLKQGMDDSDVARLQQFLGTHGFPVAQTGWGSINQPATLFGVKTVKALKRYQASIGLPATGYFGPMTRASVNDRLRSGN